jgi:hypothetical protein
VFNFEHPISEANTSSSVLELCNPRDALKSALYELQAAGKKLAFPLWILQGYRL